MTWWRIVAINAFLVGIWALSGAGYFWPGWVLAVWGLGLILRGWDLFYRPEVTEADVQREMRKLELTLASQGSRSGLFLLIGTPSRPTRRQSP